MKSSIQRGHAWGISMGGMNWSAHAAPFDREQPTSLKGSNKKNIPVSVLVGRMVAEPLRLDYWSPPHPRGTAAPWPPEAKVSREIGSGRFPVAAAWTGRVDNSPDNSHAKNEIWHWNFGGEEHELSSLDAIASAASQLAKMHAKEAPSSIVIPNDFRQREQQKLLDACAVAGTNTSLLWLPVAAVLAWLDQQHGLLGPPKTAADEPLALPVVHADWGQVRCSTLQLVPKEEEAGLRWIPARRRPIVSDWHTPGFGWSESAACDSHSTQAAWMQRFAVPKSERVPSSFGSGSNLLEQIVGWSVDQRSSWQVDLALAEHLSAIPNPIAIVFVGDFADQVANGEHVKRQLLGHKHSPLVADGVSGEKLLALGAAVFARDRAEGRVSYLDTLPDLELFIDRTHSYDWFSLLGSNDQFVPGGKKWELPDPIEGLALRRGATSIKMVLAHEEYDGVREITAKFDQAAEIDLPVQLRVTATPAQGNATLELVSDEYRDHPSKRVLANWSRMAPILDSDAMPFDKQRYIKTRPRAFPNVRPRVANYQRWRAFEKRVLHLLARQVDASRLNKNHVAVGRLLDASRTAGGAAPMNSDGCPPDGEDQESVQAITEVLTQFLLLKGNDNNRLVSDVMKILGFTCALHPELAAWLKRTVPTHPQMDEPYCILCGSCIRSPKVAEKFINRLLNEINVRGRSRLLNYQMQSLGKLMSYRQDVLSTMTAARMYDVVRECLKVFSDQNERDNLAWLFEHSGLVIVYSLRYRVYDQNFLPPESDLALEAKGEFESALRKLAKFLDPKSSIAGRLRGMFSIRIGTLRSRGRGSSGNYISPHRADRLATALVQLIDYIDRRGEGDILIALDE